MELFVCILKEQRHVDELLLMMSEEGLPGATIVRGSGMGQLFHDEPLLSLFRAHFPRGGERSYLLFSVLSQEQIELCFSLLEQSAGPLDAAGNGIAFTLPLGRVVGLERALSPEQ